MTVADTLKQLKGAMTRCGNLELARVVGNAEKWAGSSDPSVLLTLAGQGMLEKYRESWEEECRKSFSGVRYGRSRAASRASSCTSSSNAELKKSLPAVLGFMEGVLRGKQDVLREVFEGTARQKRSICGDRVQEEEYVKIMVLEDLVDGVRRAAAVLATPPPKRQWRWSRRIFQGRGKRGGTKRKSLRK
tara:strand:+ start:596 stop:1162 length:567 start_codon:yes stop_codon:yes gene_type:complete